MRKLPLAAVVAAAAIGGLLATSAQAHAGFQQPFRADSGDSCRYGFTQGYLTWHYRNTAPIAPVTVDVRGSITDRPTPADPGYACRDDRYFAVASFTAYLTNGTRERKEARADNEVAGFSFTLGQNATASSISRLVVQVCRYPLVSTSPPSRGYCGMPQTYAPPVYDPPGAAAHVI